MGKLGRVGKAADMLLSNAPSEAVPVTSPQDRAAQQLLEYQAGKKSQARGGKVEYGGSSLARGAVQSAQDKRNEELVQMLRSLKEKK